MTNKTETELLQDAIRASGGTCDDLPDTLPSTLYKKLIETCSSGGGGSGGGLPTGGAPHQQLVTDGDGNAKWEDRLCYEEEGTAVFDGTLAFDEYGQGMIAEAIDVVDGEEYNVYWNGTLYPCTASTFSNEGMTGTVLGNLGAMTGGALTGEPFVMVVLPPELAAEAGAGAQVVAFDGSETVTLKIAKNVVHKIPEKFYEDDTPVIDLIKYGFASPANPGETRSFNEIGLTGQDVADLRKKVEKLRAIFVMSNDAIAVPLKFFGTGATWPIDRFCFNVVYGYSTRDISVIYVEFNFDAETIHVWYKGSMVNWA